MRFGVKEIMSEDQTNGDYNITEEDGNEYVGVNNEISNASDRELELLENVPRDSKEEVCEDDEITAKLDENILDTNEENRSVDAKEYSEAILAKPRKITK